MYAIFIQINDLTIGFVWLKRNSSITVWVTSRPKKCAEIIQIVLETSVELFKKLLWKYHIQERQKSITDFEPHKNTWKYWWSENDEEILLRLHYFFELWSIFSPVPTGGYFYCHSRQPFISLALRKKWMLNTSSYSGFKFFVHSQAPQAQNTWCMRQLMYIENCMGKSPIVKKLCK